MRSRARGLGNHKTRVRAIRIDTDLDEALEKIAQIKGVTFNSLISTILSKYNEWDNQADAFGYAEAPVELVRTLLYTDLANDIEEVGRELGPRLLKETLEFWYKTASIETFIEYTGLLSRYGGVARISVDLKDGEYALTYRHPFGERWSRFAAAYYGEALRVLFGAQSKVNLSWNQVILKWAAVGRDTPILLEEVGRSSYES